MASTFRQRLVGAALETAFESASALGRLHPESQPARHGIEVYRNISYGPRPSQRLDVWDPPRTDSRKDRPAVVYFHGGGFRMLSKQSHWIFGLSFARRGYVVFNVDYRLSPQHRFPAAVEDAMAAYRWVLSSGPRYGADPAGLVLAGESAGANLATAVAIASCFDRPEPYAQRVFEKGAVPGAVVAACGLLQVSDMARFDARLAGPSFVRDRVRDRMEMIEEAYLGRRDRRRELGDLALANPLVFLEGKTASARPLPPFFAPCGSRDPIRDDSRRLAAALARRGVRCDAPVYEGEHHAFHAFPFRPQARRCWHDTEAFLADVLERSPPRRGGAPRDVTSRARESTEGA